MKIKLGNSDISDIRLGSNQISAVYAGDTKIFPETVTAPEPVCMSAASSQIVSMTKASALTLQYSYNKEDWVNWTGNSLGFGYSGYEVIYFRGNNNQINGGFKFTNTSVGVYVSGNAMSLINYTTPIYDLPASYTFFGLFDAQYALRTVSSDFLPATGLTSQCYAAMFRNCTGLTSAPDLPSTTIATWCYSAMFQNCRGLTKSPYLPAPTLLAGSYNCMFYDCRNLVEMHSDATSVTASNCIDGFTQYCTTYGNFYGKSAANWPRGYNGIPYNWTMHYV